MFQVITIGSALVDIFVHSQQFQSKPSAEGQLLCQLYGDKVDVESFRVYTGGGATNTAVGFKRLGFQTAVVCELGRDDFAKIILSDLQREQVSTQLVVAEKKEQTGGSVVLVGQDGGRTVLVHRGAASQLDTYDVPFFWLTQTRWVHLSGISGRVETLQKIFQLLKRNHEVGLSWNPGKAELDLISSGQLVCSEIPCQIFVVNQEEWTQVAAKQAEILQAFSQVIITAGKAGGQIYLDGKPTWSFSGQTIAAVDETGAGDAFVTGYVAAHLLGLPPQTSVAWGVHNAGSVVNYYGAKVGLLDRQRLAKVITAANQVQLQGTNL
jgi:sugar/nucleoside kinase (ribokinase family)